MRRVEKIIMTMIIINNNNKILNTSVLLLNERLIICSEFLVLKIISKMLKISANGEEQNGTRGKKHQTSLICGFLIYDKNLS